MPPALEKTISEKRSHAVQSPAWTNQELDSLLTMKAGGCSVEKIASQLKRTKSAVISALNIYGGGDVVREKVGALRCPNCGSAKTVVTDSRSGDSALKHGSVRRRRRCADCDTRYTTMEIMASDYKELVLIRKPEALKAEINQAIEALEKMRNALDDLA